MLKHHERPSDTITSREWKTEIKHEAKTKRKKSTSHKRKLNLCQDDKAFSSNKAEAGCRRVAGHSARRHRSWPHPSTNCAICMSIATIHPLRLR